MKTQTTLVTRRFVSLMGALGTVICVAGCLGVWYVEWRIDQARERLFERVEQSLAAVDSRLIQTQNLAARSKITVEEIQQRMQDWTKKEASERLAVRFDVEARAQNVAAALRQAELMLEISNETVQHVHRALEIGAELGIALNADSITQLLERIAGIKGDVSLAIDTVENLLKQFGEGGDDESMRNWAEQFVAIAARLLATFGKVDSRLASFRTQVTNAKDATSQLSAKTHTRVLVLAVCATLFLLWMAAGQYCLWRWAPSC